MQFDNVFRWLEQTALAIFIRDSLWAFPIIETIHIVGFVMLVGSAFLFDLRLLGVAKKLSVQDVASYVLPWSRRSLLVVVPSGILLFVSQAAALSANDIFSLKLILIMIALINAALFHRFTFRTVRDWSHGDTPAAAKISAIASLVLWTSVITCGRLIAYF